MRPAVEADGVGGTALPIAVPAGGVVLWVPVMSSVPTGKGGKLANRFSGSSLVRSPIRSLFLPSPIRSLFLSLSLSLLVHPADKDGGGSAMLRSTVPREECTPTDRTADHAHYICVRQCPTKTVTTAAAGANTVAAPAAVIVVVFVFVVVGIAVFVLLLFLLVVLVTTVVPCCCCCWDRRVLGLLLLVSFFSRSELHFCQNIRSKILNYSFFGQRHESHKNSNRQTIEFQKLFVTVNVGHSQNHNQRAGILPFRGAQ